MAFCDILRGKGRSKGQVKGPRVLGPKPKIQKAKFGLPPGESYESYYSGHEIVCIIFDASEMT